MTTDRDELYPQPDEIGEIDHWCLPLNYGELTIIGQFLGVSTSQQSEHSHPGPFVTDDRKCPRCRWFEPRMFHETEGEHRYVMYTIGCSDVPSEKDLIRYRFGRDAHEALAVMKTPHPKTGIRSLVGVTRRMFEQAAELDPEIKRVMAAEYSTSVPDSGRVWHR